MKQLKLILVLGLLKFSIQQPQEFFSSEQLIQEITENLINCEAKVLKKISDLSAYVRISSLNLKAISITPSLSSVLDTALTSIKQISTCKKFLPYVQLANLSTCDYVNLQKSFIDLNMRKCYSIISDMEGNVEQIHKNIADVNFNYGTNLRVLAMNWTRELSVLAVSKQMILTFNEHWKYIGWLKASLTFFNDFQTFLDQTFLICTNSTSKFKDDGNKMELKLEQCQTILVNYEELTYQKIDAALTTVSSSLPILKSSSPPSTQKYSLKKMKNNLGKFKTANDHKKVTWPHIPDATGRATSNLPMRLRACKEKKEDYTRLIKSHEKNQTKLEDDQNELTANLQSSRKVRSTNLAIDEVLNTTLAIKNQFKTCITLLNDSIAQIDQMIIDIEVGMNFSCGTALPYDTVSDPLGPEIRGFAAGTHIDGTIAYMGYGNNTGGNQHKCTGRVSVKSKGVFMGQGASILFDNKAAFYLLRHPDLQFVTTNTTQMLTLPGLILNNKNGTLPFAYGRKFNGTNVMVGKVHAGGGPLGLYYSTGSSELVYRNDYEVVVCFL